MKNGIGLLTVLTLFFLLSTTCVAQEESVFRLNLINPGVEYEHAISAQQKLIVNAGYGWVTTTPNTAYVPTDASRFFLPFLDIHYRKLKGEESKLLKGFEPYWGLRFLASGKHEYSGGVSSSPNYSIGPTYGIQKRFTPFYLTINAGPAYYFSLDFYESSIDFESGIYGMVELSLSYEL